MSYKLMNIFGTFSWKKNKNGDYDAKNVGKQKI